MFSLKFLTQHFVLVTMFCVDQVQSSFLLLFPPSPTSPTTTQSSERVDSLQGGFGGVKLKAQQREFFGIESSGAGISLQKATLLEPWQM